MSFYVTQTKRVLMTDHDQLSPTTHNAYSFFPIGLIPHVTKVN